MPALPGGSYPLVTLNMTAYFLLNLTNWNQRT